MDVDNVFEETLRKIAPAELRIDRDALMFRAGRATARRGLRLWQGTVAVLVAALAVALPFSLRPDPPPVERVVHVMIEKPVAAPTPETREIPRPRVPEPAALEAPRPSGTASYVQLRNRILTHGFEALPEPSPGWTGDADDVRDLWDALYPGLGPDRPFPRPVPLPGEPT